MFSRLIRAVGHTGDPVTERLPPVAGRTSVLPGGNKRGSSASAEPSMEPVSRGPEEDAELAINVRGLSKSFAIPGHHETTLKGRVLGRPGAAESRRLHVLQDISFDVGRGEFFGIIGRNGSGKSTLLKLLAGIYRADAGRIRIAPRVAPVIELGVGFQQDLPAWHNVVLNAEMIGLTTEQARARFDDIVRFAELQDFVDLKLKNYSSGMRMRLAFAIAMEMDADVLLLDEVGAVGDAVFKKKSEEVFTSVRDDPTKTVVLVTHGLGQVERFCDRAMLIEGARIESIGDPADVVRRHYEVLFHGSGEADAEPARRREGLPVLIDSVAVADANGDHSSAIRAGEEIRIRALVEAGERIDKLRLRLELRDESEELLFAPRAIHLTPDRGRLEPGEAVLVEATIENKLAPGRYTVTCAAWGPGKDRPVRVSEPRTIDFTVAPGVARTAVRCCWITRSASSIEAAEECKGPSAGRAAGNERRRPLGSESEVRA